jgi:hypothetical protein
VVSILDVGDGHELDIWVIHFTVTPGLVGEASVNVLQEGNTKNNIASSTLWLGSEVTDTVVRVDVSESGQGAERVVVSSDRDIDGHLGALEVPQPGMLLISGALEVLVQLLGDRVWDVDPRMSRVDIGGDLAFGGTMDIGLQRRVPTSPRNGINESVVVHAVVHAVVVQVGILGDVFKIRDVVLLEVLLGDVEDLGQVDDLADGENTTKSHIGSFVLVEGVDEQGPIEPGIWLGKDTSDEGISRPVAKRLSDSGGIWPNSESSIGTISVGRDWEGDMMVFVINDILVGHRPTTSRHRTGIDGTLCH